MLKRFGLGYMKKLRNMCLFGIKRLSVKFLKKNMRGSKLHLNRHEMFLSPIIKLFTIAVLFLVIILVIHFDNIIDEKFFDYALGFSFIVVVGSIVGLFADRLAKEKSKSKLLAKIVQDANTGIISVDLEGVIETWNTSAEMIYGFTEQDAVGHKIGSFVNDYNVSCLIDAFEKIKQGARLVQVESTHMTKAEQKLDISMMIYPSIMDSKHIVKGVSICVRDITQEKAFQKRLILADRLTSIGMLTSSIAHEVRNPLVVSDGVIRLIKNNFGDLAPNSQIPSLVELLSRSFIRIKEIAEGLTAYSSSHNKPEQMVDLHAEIHESIGLLKHFLVEKKVKIITQLDSTVAELNCTPGKMQQIVVNLVMNSIYALKGREGASIEVKTYDIDGFFILQLSDNGCGIENNNLDKVFEPFFTTKANEHGTGLGLPIVNFIVDSLGGKVEVASQLGQGTTFTITLPYDRNHRMAAFQPKKESETTKYSSLKGHILLVEDDPDTRFITNKFLVEFGLTVEMAENGIDGLKKMQREKFACIVTDLKMPEMDGCELIAEIRNKHLQPNAKLFVVTGYLNSIPCHRRSFIRANIDGIIIKPFSQKELYEKLASVLATS